MIRVFDGLRYNTETAKCVFCYSNGAYFTDFRYRAKDLYCTKNGAWFIHHTGGAMSDMAVTVGNGSAGSEDIEAVSADDAYGFLEAHSADDDAQIAIDNYFADRVVDA